MKSFYELWTIIEADAAPSPNPQEIYNQLVKTVDAWRDQTLQDLQNKTKEFKQPSLWQRFKGGVQNLWYGRDNVKNPMYNQNAYGHGWGQQQKAEECVEKLSVLFENAQKEVDDFFMALNEEADASAPAADNLKIFNFIKEAAEKLKAEIQKVLGLAPAPAPAPTTTTTPAP